MNPHSLLPIWAGILMVLASCHNTPAPEVASDSPGEEAGWDMKAYQFVTLTRHPNRPELDSALLAQTMAGHLAHLDSLYQAGIIRLVGPFGDDRDIRGIALLDVPDSATAMAHMSADPSVQAGIFQLDSRPWWGPAHIDITASAPDAP